MNIMRKKNDSQCKQPRTTDSTVDRDSDVLERASLKMESNPAPRSVSSVEVATENGAQLIVRIFNYWIT